MDGGRRLKRKITAVESRTSGINPIIRPIRTYQGGRRRYNRGSLRTMVQDIVQSMDETKLVTNLTVESAVNTLAAQPYVYNFPVPAVAASSVGRLGNTIKPVGISAKAAFFNPNSIPVFVRFLVLAVKGGQAFTNANIQNELFETPAGVDGGNTGFLYDLTVKINREQFTVLRDTVVQLDGNTTQYGFAQEKFYRKMKSLMRFPDGDFTQPATDRYVVVAIPKLANADETTGSAIELTLTLDMYYKEM